MGALYKGLIVSGVLSAIAFYPITIKLMDRNGLYPAVNLYYAALIGLGSYRCCGTNYRILHFQILLSSKIYS